MATAASSASNTRHEDRFLHVKAISIDFVNDRPRHATFIQIQVIDQIYESPSIAEGMPMIWDCGIYVSSASPMCFSVHRTQKKSKKLFTYKPYAESVVSSNNGEMEDESSFIFSDEQHHIRATFQLGTSIQLKEVVKLLGADVSSALAGKVIFLDKIGRISDFVEVVLKVGGAFSELSSPAKIVLELAKALFESFKEQRECHGLAVSLAEEIHAKLPIVEIIPERMQNDYIRSSLRTLLEVIREAFIFLDKYAQVPSLKQLLSSQKETIAELHDKLSRASQNFHLSLTAGHYVESREREEHAMHEKMRPALGARFSDGHPCMAGTRLSTLQQIMEWCKAKSSTSSFWVYGTAGSGKSTIACTVCEQLRNKNTLAGSFFCKRDIPDQRDPRRILPSLSYTLASKVEPYRDLVLKAIENEPDISTSPLTLQLTTLFITPFATLGEQGHPRQSLVFVIDALDECGDTASRAQLADCLCRIATLSDWLKILVTSRPLPELAQVFDISHSSTVAPLDLNLISAENDIILYTKARLEALVKERRLNVKWLSDDSIYELATKASGMFIWTTTVMDFVSARYDSEKAMNAIISDDIKDGSKSSLDALYSSILKMTRGGSGNEEDLTYLKTVLGIICITAKNQPLSMIGQGMRDDKHG